MTCLKCKADLLEGSKFCPQCGKPVPQTNKQEKKELPVVMTLNEASKFLKISRCTMYKLINARKIPYTLVGMRKRFLTKKLIEFLEGA